MLTSLDTSAANDDASAAGRGFFAGAEPKRPATAGKLYGRRSPKRVPRGQMAMVTASALCRAGSCCSARHTAADFSIIPGD